MNKLNSILDLCHLYIAKLGGREFRASLARLKSARGRRRRAGILSTLVGSALLFASCQDPQQIMTETVYEVSLLAGSTEGYKDGTGAGAQFKSPSSVAVDSAATVYVSDTGNNRIRKISSAGVVSLLAGSATAGASEGTGAAAQFKTPIGVAVGADGMVYVSDYANNRIRKISSAAVVSLFAGSTMGYREDTGAAAQFFGPYGIAAGSAGTVYVADSVNNRIRKIDSGAVVSLLAGSTGGYREDTGAAAQFKTPIGVAVGADGTVYVADTFNHRIRKITPEGVVSLLAGSVTAGYKDGSGAAAQFNEPYGVAVGSDGTVYVADSKNNRIRKITPEGVVSLLAGSGTAGYKDGSGAEAQFNEPDGVAVGSDGTVYVADTGNNRIRKITPQQVAK